MKSIWSRDVEIPEREVPMWSKYRDVVVIGAGMAGILTAYYLKNQGFKVAVLEADRIAGGQTCNTTAKITSQHGLIYSKLIKKVGMKKARLYARAHEEAIKEYDSIIREKNIDCHFEKLPAYLYSFENEEPLREEAAAAAALGIDASFVKDAGLPFETVGAVCFKNQAQFNPLEFIKEISKDIEIYENTKVTGVHGNIISTDNATFMADKIVFATHYPIVNLPGLYFIRQHQERSYVLALSGCRKLEGMYYGIDDNGISLRSYNNTLLLGGGSHRTGENTSGGSYDSLREASVKYFPGSKEICCWSAQDCMPHDDIQFIGKYFYGYKSWYVATGFKKWGMTSSMVAARLLADLMSGKENQYRKLFTPQRHNIRAAAGPLFKDIGHSVKGLTKGLCHRAKQPADELMNGHGGIVKVNGERCACYRDNEGRLHMISARCPHMGCELSWNPDELSWDCPCHGSRFDIDGKLLDVPAQKDNVS